VTAVKEPTGIAAWVHCRCTRSSVARRHSVLYKEFIKRTLADFEFLAAADSPPDCPPQQVAIPKAIFYGAARLRARAAPNADNRQPRSLDWL
jgi:hypothetical protein